MLKRLLALFICILLVTASASTLSEHSRAKHDQLLELILFGDEYYSAGKSQTIKDSIIMLKNASFLCLDQFNHTGISELKQLQNFGVHNLPASISEIDFKANYDHRANTHRGWDYSYEKDIGNWKVRKRILIETVNHVFDFGFGSGRYLGVDRYNKKCTSLAAVIYYIHVLQDHLENKGFKPLIIPLVRKSSNDSLSIIDEFEKHFAILFIDEIDSHVYKTMLSDIELIRKEAETLVNSVGGLNTEEKLDEYYHCCERLRDILKDGVHLLLHRCDFFIKVFPVH